MEDKRRIHTQLYFLHKKGRLGPFSFRKFTHNSIFCTKFDVILTLALLTQQRMETDLQVLNLQVCFVVIPDS